MIRWTAAQPSPSASPARQASKLATASVSLSVGYGDIWAQWAVDVVLRLCYPAIVFRLRLKTIPSPLPDLSERGTQAAAPGSAVFARPAASNSGAPGVACNCDPAVEL